MNPGSKIKAPRRRTLALALVAVGAIGACERAARADEDIEVPAAKAPAKQAASSEDLAALRKELEALQAKVEELEAKVAAPHPEPAKPDGAGLLQRLLGASAFDVSGYVQAQFEWHEDSLDEIAQNGQSLNQDRFVVRRGRIRLDAAWEWTAFSLEIDGSTSRGPAVGVRRAEASVLWRGPWGPKASDLRALRGDGPPPLMMLTAGLMDIPFGFELAQSSKDRVFMERSTGSLAFFPAEPDVGARLSGGAAFFRYALAIMNGEPVDTSSRGGDSNTGKDFLGRLGVDVQAAKPLRIAGGVSALRGKGFHPGTPATKGTTTWNDTNENGVIDTGEVTGSPATAATPSSTFDRWAVGVDLEVYVKTPMGTTFVYGEATLAENLDRGLVIANPTLTGGDLRELSVGGGLVQQITPYAFVGLRADYYDPNGDYFDSRGGKLIPTSQGVRTISPIAGACWPERGKLILQYDNVRDSLGREAHGVPEDLPNDRFTARLQVDL